MSLDVPDRLRVHVGEALRDRDHLGLPGDARRHIPDLGRPVVVQGEAADHRDDRVSVRERIGETLQDHDSDAGPEHGPRGRRVEGAASPVGRAHGALLVDVAPLLRKRDRDAARESRVAVVMQESPASEADGHE